MLILYDRRFFFLWLCKLIVTSKGTRPPSDVLSTYVLSVSVCMSVCGQQTPCGVDGSPPCGPENWAYKFPSCANDGTQSPINLSQDDYVKTGKFGPLVYTKDHVGCGVVEQFSNEVSVCLSLVYGGCLRVSLQYLFFREPSE